MESSLLAEPQVKEGVRALHAYIAKSKESKEKDSKTKDLFGDEEGDIFLSFALKKNPEERTQPYRIPLKHSLYGDGAEICLFTKDPQSDYQEKLAQTPVKGVTKVIGMQKLRHNYIKYQDKRNLLKSYQFFLADERIIPLLPPLLGKKFFLARKQPIPVNLKLKNIAGELTKARDATYLYIRGACCTVRIAKTSWTQEQIVENILAAIQPIVSKFPQKKKAIQAIYLKTTDSIAIPLYNLLPNPIILETLESPPDRVIKEQRETRKRKIISELTAKEKAKAIKKGGKKTTKKGKKKRVKKGSKKGTTNKDNKNKGTKKTTKATGKKRKGTGK